MCDSSIIEDEITLYSLAEEKIETGEKLISALDEFKQISGVNKIQKKITSEIIYLQKVSKHLCLVVKISGEFDQIRVDLTGNSIEKLENQ